MSKSVWVIVIMGLVTALVLSVAMALSLSQFTEVPAVEWVRLAEMTTTEFKLENVAVRVNLRDHPSSMRITYLTRADSKFDTTVQNAEMEKVAKFAVQNYKGRELNKVEQIQITRSEIHGRGCFQQTYVAGFTYKNPKRGGVQLHAFPPSER